MATRGTAEGTIQGGKKGGVVGGASVGGGALRVAEVNALEGPGLGVILWEVQEFCFGAFFLANCRQAALWGSSL